jgi:hypothetical protein
MKPAFRASIRGKIAEESQQAALDRVHEPVELHVFVVDGNAGK